MGEKVEEKLLGNEKSHPEILQLKRAYSLMRKKKKKKKKKSLVVDGWHLISFDHSIRSTEERNRR